MGKQAKNYLAEYANRYLSEGYGTEEKEEVEESREDEIVRSAMGHHERIGDPAGQKEMEDSLRATIMRMYKDGYDIDEILNFVQDQIKMATKDYLRDQKALRARE
jgi:hypothetical protein